ncbi:hypothetical protein B9T38_16345 [Acinetobacter sp. ANC 4218]|uniref:YagK/YfjJ domain-containing protein n=1 Tax=Acinetobacter sp. ANC 4218 TaxID=1977880 RepID=UPI000A336D50|nr:inovirus-type Gp2 protein [Acinetobacter sp. ANC 4218]OTG67726.1 hypothetical protein B9T38_16345 [Acinetobacter sp. ANC 4218]
MIEDDYLADFDDLLEYGSYLKVFHNNEKEHEWKRSIGHSLELLENLMVIEKQLRILENDKSEINIETYNSLLKARWANPFIKENFPLSGFSPYVTTFFQKTDEMQLNSKLELLQATKAALSQPDFKKSTIQNRKQYREKQTQLSRYINSLFAYSPKLLVIESDLSYLEEWDYNCVDESLKSQRIEQIQNERNKLITKLKQKYKKDLIGYIWKIDYSLEKNFHYNIILFLKVDSQTENDIVDFIKQAWTEITDSKGIHLNKNCHNFGSNDSNQIEDKEKRKALLDCALHLVRMDYSIKMKLYTVDGKSLHTFDRGQTPKRIQPKKS